MKSQAFKATLLAALVALTIGSVPTATAATPKNQLIVGFNMANLTSIDPHNTNSIESHHVIANVYDNLVRLDPQNRGKLIPGVAESWSTLDDGTIIFKLRKNVTFHTGRKMTAEDVAYSLRRSIKLGLLGASYLKQWGYTPQNVDEKFYAKDEYTFVLAPADPLSPNLKLMALTRTVGAIVDKEVIAKNEKDGDMGRAWLASHEAGSGPYTLVQWNPNDVLLMTRAKDYWGGNAKLDRVVIRHLPESQVERLQLEKGDLDVAMQLVSADIDGLAKNPKITIERVLGSGYYYLAFSMKDPDFAKPEVRRALRYCIDYEGINSGILKNYGQVGNSIVPKDIPGYVPNIGNKYDPAKCKKDLVAAGYPNGLKKQLLALSSVPYSDIATAVQQNLSKAGVTAEIRTGNGDQVYGPMRNRQFEMIIGRTGSSAPTDPDGWVRTVAYNPDNSDASKLSNLQAWRESYFSPEVNKLIDEAGSINDEKKRAELYAKAVTLYEESAPPFIPISRFIDPFARSSALKNYHPSLVGMTRWNEVEK
ncbi:ABC transporter substrate-binding protein [Uliginosibacterium sp. sgz301328]|uniref:ABC transporter substrate-binding protein n=1 Tax=Uliginosibacterium sp. sgz301328 TaxID=3243764 RepID=UPI00359DF386